MPRNLEIESTLDTTAKRVPLRQRLTQDEMVMQFITDATKRLEIYEGHLLLHEDYLSPQDAIERLRRQIGQSNSMVEVAKINERIAMLSTQPVDVRLKAQSLARQQFEPARAALIALCDRALELLDEYRSEAELDEEILFAQYGLTRHATEVSRRVERVIEEVRQFRRGLSEIIPHHSSLLPSKRSHVLDYFTAGES